MIVNILSCAALFASLTMFITWLYQNKYKDASYVDVSWAASIGIIALSTYIYTSLFSAQSLFNLFSLYNLRYLIITLCALFWSFRLASYLAIRIFKSRQEDTRYKTMRIAMGNKANLGFFIFFQLQALFVIIFSCPIIIALLTKQVSWQLTDTLAILIFIIAFVGESIADKQLYRFKQQYPQGKTCQTGLWYYSRHPNYFFEWLHWFTYALFSINSPYFIFTIIAPFLMLFFILKLTGIPHVENEAIKNKPDYADYKSTTSMFIPWFKKVIKG